MVRKCGRKRCMFRIVSLATLLCFVASDIAPALSFDKRADAGTLATRTLFSSASRDESLARALAGYLDGMMRCRFKTMPLAGVEDMLEFLRQAVFSALRHEEHLFSVAGGAKTGQLLIHIDPENYILRYFNPRMHNRVLSASSLTADSRELIDAGMAHAILDGARHGFTVLREYPINKYLSFQLLKPTAGKTMSEDLEKTDRQKEKTAEKIEKDIREIAGYYALAYMNGATDGMRVTPQGHHFVETENKVLVNMSRHFLSEGGRVLDLGSGNAKAVAFFSKFADHVTGIEIDCIARSKGNIDRLYEIGKKNIKNLAQRGVVDESKIGLEAGDFLDDRFDFSEYDVIYLYWPYTSETEKRYECLIEQKLLGPKGLKPGAVFVLNSNGYTGGFKGLRRIDIPYDKCGIPEDVIAYTLPCSAPRYRESPLGILEEKGYRTKVISSFRLRDLYYVQAVKAGALVREIADSHGFGEDEKYALDNLAHEMVTNMLKYAGGGVFGIKVVEDDGRKGIELVGWDQGPGMENPELKRRQSFAREETAISSGFNPADAEGKGLRSYSRQADKAIIESLAKRWERSSGGSFRYAGPSDIRKGTRVRLTVYRKDADRFAGEKPGSPATAVKILTKYKELCQRSGFTQAQYEKCLKDHFTKKGKEARVSRSTCWRDLTELEKKGILRKIRAPDDRRKNIYLTDLPLLKQSFLKSLRFYPYTELPEHLKSDELYILIRKMHDEFKCTVPRNLYRLREEFDREWQKAGRYEYSDAMVVLSGGEPIAIYGFAMSQESGMSWGEGIYISSEYRRRGVGNVLRDVLFSYLKQKGIKEFAIGDTSHISSGPVRKSRLAQAFHRDFIQRHRYAVEGIRETPGGRLSGFTVNLAEYEPEYNYERPLRRATRGQQKARFEESAIQEGLERIIPELVNGLITAGYGEEKVVLAIDEELGSGWTGDGLRDLMKALSRLTRRNDELGYFLKNVVIRHGKGQELSADLGAKVKNGVRKENIIIVTSNENRRRYFRGFEGVSIITGIEDRELTEDFYYPLVEVVLFTLGRALRYSREDMLRCYKDIPNIEQLDDDTIWDLCWDKTAGRYKTTIVIRLIPGAVKLSDKDFYNRIVRIINSAA